MTLFINTKENVSSQKQVQEEASALENKLGHIEACQAAEEYGKKQYPYGFKLHYMSGMYGYAVSGKNKDTWKIKCTATITNAYNASQEVDCEFKVTGTNTSQIVVYHTLLVISSRVFLYPFLKKRKGYKIEKRKRIWQYHQTKR